MEQAKITIIICTWNRCKVLLEMLQSLEAQIVPASWDVEVVVVDNNSRDETFAQVQSVAKRWRLGQLRVVREQRQGKQFALNRAIQESTGNLLAFTDDDVIVSPNWLRSITAVFSNPRIEMAGGKTILLWPGGSAPTWFRQSMLAVVAGVDLGDQAFENPPADYAPAGTNLIVRRQVFDRIGVFSEKHFRHMDYEFGMRAAHHGVAVHYDPRLIVQTHVPREALSREYFRKWYFKLGIASAMSGASTSQRLLGVPRWMWRALVEDLASMCWFTLRGRVAEAFACETRCRQWAGFISATWHGYLSPASHHEWVERRSQKHRETFV